MSTEEEFSKVESYWFAVQASGGRFYEFHVSEENTVTLSAHLLRYILSDAGYEGVTILDE